MNSRLSSLVVWAMCPGFLGLAAFLAFASPEAGLDRGEVRNVPVEDFRAGPRRTPLRDAADCTVNGVKRSCADCHRLFSPSPVEARVLVQHKDIKMNHGINARCFNCHLAADRDYLVLHDGTLIRFAESPRLCSNCHGTLYRDWQAGSHGKTTGSWDASSGAQRRLMCTECHDPHSPAYQHMAPLPGPRTMRMGDQSRPDEHEGKHSPLRRYSNPGEAGPSKEPAHGPAEAPKEHRP